jgi:hypothetical protein
MAQDLPKSLAKDRGAGTWFVPVAACEARLAATINIVAASMSRRFGPIACNT